MRASPVWTLLVFAALARADPAGAAPRRAPVDSVAGARQLVRWARQAVADGSIEDRQRAVRDLRRSLELDPSNPEAWLLLGQVHETGGSGGLARRCFRKAIDVAPKELDGWMELSARASSSRPTCAMDHRPSRDEPGRRSQVPPVPPHSRSALRGGLEVARFEGAAGPID